MKTFQQFNEDVNQLRKDLDTLDRRSAPKQKLAARKEALKQRSQEQLRKFKEKSK
jgi:hypothetical protein